MNSPLQTHFIKLHLIPPKEGSCQFACIAHALQRFHEVCCTAESIRAEIVSFIQKPNALPHIAIENFVEKQNFPAYVRNILKPFTYGDNIILQAAPERFGLKMFVISSLGEKHNRIVSKHSSQENDVICETLMKPIYLGHYAAEENGAHYVVFQTPDRPTQAFDKNLGKCSVCYNF